MAFSKIKNLNLENLKREKMNSGIYKLLDRNKKVIYVGVSNKLKHRLFAVLYGSSDYAQIRGKMKIKKNSKYYQIMYIEIKKARKLEKELKKSYF